MLELYQYESCPECKRVRAKLSDLLLDWISRTVPEDPDRRDRVVRITGRPDLPILVDPEHRMVVTEADDICDYLDEVFGPGSRAPEP